MIQEREDNKGLKVMLLPEYSRVHERGERSSIFGQWREETKHWTCGRFSDARGFHESPTKYSTIIAQTQLVKEGKHWRGPDDSVATDEFNVSKRVNRCEAVNSNIIKRSFSILDTGWSLRTQCR